MTGPLLIALSLLLLLLSCRQFLLARKRNTNSHPTMQVSSTAAHHCLLILVVQKTLCTADCSIIVKPLTLAFPGSLSKPDL